MKIVHYPGCSADYPEKPEGEKPQQIMIINLDDGSGDCVYQCSDCGAFVIEQEALYD